MRILVICLGASGHINPVLGMLERLVEGGHTVGWIIDPPERKEGAWVIPKGVTQLTPDPWWPVRFPPSKWKEGGTSHDLVDAREGSRGWTRMMGLGLAGIEKLIVSFKPDVVACDGYLWNGLIAAHRAGIPYASICTGLHFLAPEGFLFPTEELELPSLKPGFAAFFAKYGMAPELREMYAFSPHLNVVFTTEEFVGSDVVRPPKTHLVGPSIAPAARSTEASGFPWERLRADKRVVFASLGTNFGPDAALFVRIAAAAAKLDMQLIVKVGGLKTRRFLEELPGDVLPVSFAPQLELLQRVDAFITHGGANSVAEAMYYGCPIMVVPYGIDQGLQAYFVDHAAPNAPGISVTRHITTAALVEKLPALVDPDGSARRNARRVQASYRAHDGARAAADLVVALGSS